MNSYSQGKEEKTMHNKDLSILSKIDFIFLFKYLKRWELKCDMWCIWDNKYLKAFEIEFLRLHGVAFVIIYIQHLKKALGGCSVIL